MFNHLLIDKATLKTVNYYDEYDTPVIASQEVIKCKIEFAKEYVTAQNSNNNYHLAPVKLFCNAAIKVGDIVNIKNKDYTVFQVSGYQGFDGKNIFKEVFLA